MRTKIQMCVRLLMASTLLGAISCGPQGERKIPGKKNPSGNGENGNGENGEPGKIGPFLQIDHFNKEYPSLVKITKSKIVEAINQSPIFMLASSTQSLTDGSGPELPNSACYVVSDKVEVIDSHNVTMSFHLDTAKCNPKPNSEGVVETEVQRVYASFRCSDSDLSSYATTKAYPRAFSELCPSDTIQERFVNSEYTLTLSDGKSSEFITERTAVMASDGSTCKSGRTNGTRTVSNCGTYRTRTRGNLKTSSVVVLQKVEAHDLQGFDGKKFYDSGFYDVTLNDWKGRLKYGSLGTQGGDNPPTYELKNAISRENLSGTYKFESENGGEEEEQDPEE